MRITNLLCAVFISSFLILLPALSSAQTRLTVAPAGEVTTVPNGFCCSNGQVISTTQAQCKQKRGQYYPGRAEALKHCRAATVFCCINGKVSEISPEQCKRSQGTAYRTGDEARKKCRPGAVYCCVNGKVKKVSPGECRKIKGTAYRTGDEAKRKCRPEAVYCCVKGKVKKVSPGECRKIKGTAYRTGDEAKRKCRPEAVYCCVNGKVKKVSPGECRKMKGTAYTTVAEVKRKCKPKAVYCCLKGNIKKISAGECKKKKGEPYRTEREARKNCGWCCTKNKVFSATPDSCKRKNGKYFTSKVQADHQCKEQPQCCIKGKLVIYSQLECKRNKGTYYRSPGEAKKQCRSDVVKARSKVSRQSIPGGIKSPKLELSSSMTIKDDGRSNTSSNLPPVGGGLDVPIITVVNKIVTPQTPNLDQEVTASFTVKNIGSVATSGPLPFVMKIYSSDENGIQTLAGSSVYRWHFDPFEPGDEQTISISGPMFHLGLHAASLVISRTGSSVPGGYSGDIVIPDDPIYHFFQALQSYDLGFDEYGVRHRDGYLQFKIKNYGQHIPQEQHDQLGLTLSIDNGAMLQYPMSTVDPSGILKTAGNIHTFQWPVTDPNSPEMHPYKFKIGVLLPGNGGINIGNPDSNPANNKKMIKLGGLPDLVVCYKRYMTHHPGKHTYSPKVKNIGKKPSGPAVLKFWIEGKGTKSHTINSLPPGGEQVFRREVRWWLAEMGTDANMGRDFRLIVDRDHDVDEGAVGESNNVITGRIWIKRWQHTLTLPGTSQILCSDVPGSSYE